MILNSHAAAWRCHRARHHGAAAAAAVAQRRQSADSLGSLPILWRAVSRGAGSRCPHSRRRAASPWPRRFRRWRRRLCIITHARRPFSSTRNHLSTAHSPFARAPRPGRSARPSSSTSISPRGSRSRRARAARRASAAAVACGSIQVPRPAPRASAKAARANTPVTVSRITGAIAAIAAIAAIGVISAEAAAHRFRPMTMTMKTTTTTTICSRRTLREPCPCLARPRRRCRRRAGQDPPLRARRQAPPKSRRRHRRPMGSRSRPRDSRARSRRSLNRRVGACPCARISRAHLGKVGAVPRRRRGRSCARRGRPRAPSGCGGTASGRWPTKLRRLTARPPRSPRWRCGSRRRSTTGRRRRSSPASLTAPCPSTRMPGGASADLAQAGRAAGRWARPGRLSWPRLCRGCSRLLPLLPLRRRTRPPCGPCMRTSRRARRRVAGGWTTGPWGTSHRGSSRRGPRARLASPPRKGRAGGDGEK
jgi:hypothetical protein